ncbi:VWA domain-containing protein [Saliphagus sp. GCM10025308]
MPSRRQFVRLFGVGGAAALAGCSARSLSDDRNGIDDWQYDPSDSGGNGNASANGASAVTTEADDSIGLAAGGAADVETFRRNVSEGYLPVPESMAYEGLFHDYYFDTGGDGSCDSLFCPTHSAAVSPDPLSGEAERFLSVGLESGRSQSAFERPALNLVIVLDISGSMRSSFEEYYYDSYGNRKRAEGDTSRPKIDVAKEALVDLTRQLRPEDRLGVVLFNTEAHVAKPLRSVDTTDMDAIREHIRADVEAGAEPAYRRESSRASSCSPTTGVTARPTIPARQPMSMRPGRSC